MALSENALKRLKTAVTSESFGAEIANLINHKLVAAIPAIGVTANLPPTGCLGGLSPSAAQVDTAIAVVTAAVELRLDVIEAKIDALIYALTA